jgi:hypothetical protein
MGGGEATIRAATKRPTGDGLLRGRLEQLGFAVQVLSADDEDPGLPRKLERAQVVVLSPSILSEAMSEEVANAAVPMVVLETSAFLRLGMTGRTWLRDIGPEARVSDVVVTAPGHPLAAGLAGQLTVLQKSQRVRWGLPSDDGIIVARYPDTAAGQSAVFAYERGAEMPGGRAPSRRVGLFLGNNRVINALAPDGWRLFDAAVNWSAAAPR